MTEQPNTASRMLEKAEYFIYLSAGYILVIAAAGLLVTAAIEMIHKILESHYAEGLIHLLDRVLLALMIAEIIYTVGRIARTHSLEVSPFLIVGIIAAVRRMLIITAESTEHMDFSNPTFQGAIAELGLLALIIFLLAWAIRLLEHERK